MGQRPDIPPGNPAITVVDYLRLRSKASVNSTTYRVLRWGTRLAIEAAPIAGSGYWWCRVRLLGANVVGFVAVADKNGTRWIAAGETAILVALQQHLVGTWTGTVTTPWVPSYRVSLVFRANGTYSAHTLGAVDTPAFYWGSDADSKAKTYAVRDVAADATATGDIVLYFSGSKTTRTFKLADIAFTGGQLTFNLTDTEEHGPVRFVLTRT